MSDIAYPITGLENFEDFKFIVSENLRILFEEKIGKLEGAETDISYGPLLGTADQITVTGNADGTVTFSTPQDIDTGAIPIFGGLSIAGNIAVTGTVDGVDVAALKTDVDGFPDDLKNLAATEIAELENIGATTISAAQWGYLGNLDQDLITTSNVTFGTIGSGNITSTGDVQTSAAGKGYKYHTDASGVFEHLFKDNVVAHFGATTVDGIEFKMGGQTWGYLVNTNKATGHVVPQLYLKDPPNIGTTYWESPILITSATDNGSNRAIAVVLTDTSAAGALNATGIAVHANTPSDRGGDSSGIYVTQAGGGNAVSFYKDSGGTGFAMEIRAAGTNDCIYAKSAAKLVKGVLTGADGQGYQVTPGTDIVPNDGKRAFFLTDKDSVPLFYVNALDGKIGTAGNIIGDSCFYLKERADDLADSAGYGQFWVMNDTPNNPRFTDDVGTIFNIAHSEGTTGGAGSAGAGNQYVELKIRNTVFKVLHDGTV